MRTHHHRSQRPQRTPLFLVLFLSIVSASDAASPEGFQSIFDGKTLQGWEGDPKHWRVHEGVIVGEIPAGETLNKNTWLVWRGGELADFELKLQFKLSGLPAANSGIQVRCQVDSVDHVSGYQADLDQGATWLGRIYDEHGRALLVERGSRVHIEKDGKRLSETFAPAASYGVLFRDGAWNDYHIIGLGNRIAVYVNGALFSDLLDEESGACDLRGSLALQLHAGPQTRIEFRNIQLRTLTSESSPIPPFKMAPPAPAAKSVEGLVPKDENGKQLNVGFEQGDLSGWTATGNAFDRQPVNQDGISSRWQGQVSNKQGEFFIGGYEIVRDAGIGTLVSQPFKVTHPYASFYFGGGEAPSTRAEIVNVQMASGKEEVVFTAHGDNREQMRQFVVDLRSLNDKTISIRLIDENAGGWGHLNFDDFRFHDTPPQPVETTGAWRSTKNPVLQHLIPSGPPMQPPVRGDETVAQMFIPEGFIAETIAAEPDLHQPMAFTFDLRGRLWVAEGYCYPQKRPDGEGLDRILIFSDRDGNGSFEHREIFAENLNLVSGFEVGFGGVWVGAAPQLLFIPDRDGDDRPDGPAQVLLDGFGFADTHETLNSFTWGPDGWLYGNQGVFNTSQIGPPGCPDERRIHLAAGVWRYHPTRGEFEVFAHGGSNQWGLDYDRLGQFFMTHCRSFWGRGGTTHVIQGGHFWNQVNGGHAPFVSGEATPQLPNMRNFLLASARYDHGEGGAGKPGTDLVFGGHSHVGTMIYLGDNWPSRYHNHLFTHNLHGHQINHQENIREAGGFNTVHAGDDVLFCADRQYIGVDLQYGPDGAVYISDWYDPRHCHNPDVEQWDRGNGRIYRLKYSRTWKPTQVDYTQASEQELVAAQRHANEWHARTARLVLSDRANTQPLNPSTIAALKDLAFDGTEITHRLRAIWTLHGINALDESDFVRLVSDSEESIRAWGIQLSVEQARKRSPDYLRRLVDLAQKDPSLFVLRYLASAVQRVPADSGWSLATALSLRADASVDREFANLLWYGTAPLVATDWEKGFKIAGQTPLAQLSDNLLWYAAKTSDRGRDELVARITRFDGQQRRHHLALMELAVKTHRGIKQPEAWNTIAEALYQDKDAAVRRSAETIGAAFGDGKLYARKRQVLLDPSANVDAKKQALNILSNDASHENVAIYLQLLREPSLEASVLPLLRRYDDLRIAESLVERIPRYEGAMFDSAMESLCGRVAWANLLLDRIAQGNTPKSRLTAFYARQMSSLGNEALNQRLEQEWGKLGTTTGELRAEIDTLVRAYKAAPLWAYEGNRGAEHFKKLCAQCHTGDAQNEAVAPKLGGSGAKGIEYLVENVINPNAVIGRDFQAKIILTEDGRVLTGVVEKESETALTIRTLTGSETISKDAIETIQLSPNSFMPEGLLKNLNERERIELFKFLMGL